jgi:hypothetical protein
MPAAYDPLPVSAAGTRLLRFDWELFGLIGVFEVPSAPW